jgi:poly-gamma-glutamate synthesis protein (capsule biosynthesis protein)
MSVRFINVTFAGDFSPYLGYEKITIEKKAETLNKLLPYIKKADVSFVNLECPLTKHNQPINKSGPALRASPECINTIKDFTVVGLANNHILDYGTKGLEDTLNVCHQKNLNTVGAGMSLAEAQEPFIAEVSGIKIAIVAVTEHEFSLAENNKPGAAHLDPIDNHKQIKLAQRKADIVIVTIHGGNEYFPYPRPGLRKLCKHYIDLGVEAIICHHPHVPGAYEYYQDKPIIYSLGNFIFDSPKQKKDWDLGYLANLSFDYETKKFCKLELIPYKQSVALGGIQLLEAEDRDIFLEKIENYRQKLEQNSDWLQEWSNFIKQKTGEYFLRQYLPFTVKGVSLFAKIFPIEKILFKRTKWLDKLNILRCESHRELLISAIEFKSTRPNGQNE